MGVPLHVAEEPLACVAIGSGRFLEEIDLYGHFILWLATYDYGALLIEGATPRIELARI